MSRGTKVTALLIPIPMFVWLHQTLPFYLAMSIIGAGFMYIFWMFVCKEVGDWVDGE